MNETAKKWGYTSLTPAGEAIFARLHKLMHVHPRSEAHSRKIEREIAEIERQISVAEEQAEAAWQAR